MKKILSLAAGLTAACILLTAGCGTAQTSYTVTMSEVEASEPAPETEILAHVRCSVVDITSTNETSASAGSGVIVGKGDDGNYFIVTNHHVIEGGTQFYADVLTIAGDGSEFTTVYEAKLIGSSLKRDIAVLSVTPPAGTDLTVATFVSDSDLVKVGTEVYVIGNPLGILGGTVTHGIVSATKRDVSLEEIGTMTLMQTDASVNGGNSGGGLFDRNGTLIGIINSGYDTYNGQNVEGLNFAIPANDAKFAAESLISTYREDGGKVQYGYVEGDARLDISFSTATLYTDETLSARASYLVASASASSPFYSAWNGSLKAVSSIEIGGVVTELAGGSGSYSLTGLAGETLAGARAGDEVVIRYRDVYSRQAGGFFPATYNYVGGEEKVAKVTAAQYIYEP